MSRSAVRTLERAGVPRSVAMSIVGHKTESIYRRYAIVDEAMQREAAARLDAWIAAPRHRHRRPPSLLSVEVVDSGAASRSESGHPTPAGWGLMHGAALLRTRHG